MLSRNVNYIINARPICIFDIMTFSIQSEILLINNKFNNHITINHENITKLTIDIELKFENVNHISVKHTIQDVFLSGD